MILRNWYNAFKAYRLGAVITGGLKMQSGSVTNAGYIQNTVFLNTLALKQTGVVYNTNNPGIVLGSGTTPATIDDYKLESLITSGLSSSVAVSADSDNDAILVVTITNTSSADITIGEIGMVCNCYTAANTGQQYVLCERTVLDNPITIPAGGIGKIEYAIKLTIPQE